MSLKTITLWVVTPKTPSPRLAVSQLDLLFGPETGEGKTASPKRRDLFRKTWLVHQLVAEARELMEAEFGDVWVEGEISNLRPATSGHLYFTLKDAEAQLPVVLFRRQAILLRFRPEDGMQVRVRGKASIYEQRGQLQMVAETLEPVGNGGLQLAFEQLRERLRAEGLFDQERKRPMPKFPRTVAIITSPSGAVIRDFLSIAGRRSSGLSVVVIPASMQGERAAAEIEAAVASANASAANLVVLARGGGSLEDLAAFNSERVARAIAASALPVVSAIGHETDFTIADFVADLRAPTPSAAAELITEALHQAEESLAALDHRLERGARFQMLAARQRLSRASIAETRQLLAGRLHRLEQRLDDLGFRLVAGMERRLDEGRRTLDKLATAVLSHDPRRQITAGREALAGKRSRLRHALDRVLAGNSFRCQSAETRLYRAAQVTVARRRGAFAELRRELTALSPLAVLSRGYALVQDNSGTLIRSVGQLAKGQTVHTRLGDGNFLSEVTRVTVPPASGKKTKDTAKSR